MPMPREEDDDDLFHSVDDVDFADDDAEEKKMAKKKTAKKTVAKKATTKKTATKKTVKKKVKRVSVSADENTPKPAPRKRRKKVVKAEKPAEESFGAGLFDSEAEEATEGRTEEKTEGAPEKKAPARRKRSTRKPARAETPAPAAEETAPETPAEEPQAEAASQGDEKTDEYGRTAPVANYVVHVYEFGRLKRTVDRDFTPELAEAYVTEFCRTSKRYGRQAVAGKKDTQPAKELAGEQDLLDRKSAPGAK